MPKKNDLKTKIARAKQDDDNRKQQATDQSNELSETNELKKKLSEMTEMARRAMADLQNLKRRQEEEQLNIIIRANTNLLKEFLPTLDNLLRSLEHLPQEAQQWAKGISMSISQLEKVLHEAGLKPIESIGKPFNPDLHEALLQAPGKKDIVIEELEKGYTLGDQVLRHSKVKVGNGKKA